MKISEIIMDKYKLRIPPTVYYDLLADVREVEEEQEPTTKNDLAHNLCDSCANIGCEFQSGIVRTECTFYMPPHIEPDNCGNYVNKEPTTKNDLGVDAISRQAVLDLIADYDLSMGQVVKGIHALPSVTPQEPRKGHWIMTGDYYTGAYGTIDYVECSCCHEYSLEEGNYCPNCGAKMVEPQESEDNK